MAYSAAVADSVTVEGAARRAAADTDEARIMAAAPTMRLHAVLLSFEVAGAGAEARATRAQLEAAFIEMQRVGLRGSRLWCQIAMCAGLIASLALIGANTSLVVLLVATCVLLVCFQLWPRHEYLFVSGLTTVLFVMFDVSNLYYSPEAFGTVSTCLLSVGLPFMISSLLAPPAILFAPILFGHAVCIAYGASGAAPDGASASAIMLMLCVFVAVQSYFQERRMRLVFILSLREKGARAAETASAAREAEGCRLFEKSFGYICHELRNPLHGIRGSLGLLVAGGLSDAEVHRELGAISTGVNLMVSVTNDM